MERRSQRAFMVPPGTTQVGSLQRCRRTHRRPSPCSNHNGVSVRLFRVRPPSILSRERSPSVVPIPSARPKRRLPELTQLLRVLEGTGSVRSRPARWCMETGPRSTDVLQHGLLVCAHVRPRPANRGAFTGPALIAAASGYRRCNTCFRCRTFPHTDILHEPPSPPEYSSSRAARCAGCRAVSTRLSRRCRSACPPEVSHVPERTAQPVAARRAIAGDDAAAGRRLRYKPCL